MFNLTRKMKNCIIGILLAVFIVSMGAFITFQKTVKAENDWVYIDTIAERVWHANGYEGEASRWMHIYTTADLGDAQGNAYNSMDYGELDVKINGETKTVALTYNGLRDIMFDMDVPVAGETTVEIEAGTVVKNPQWVNQVYRFTETAKFIYNANSEWVAEKIPVEKTYIETCVVVDWHGTTEEYPNTNVVLVMDKNYHANDSAITGTLGTLKVKIDGEERTVDVFDWYGAANKLAFNCEVVSGTRIEIEPNTVVEVAADVERTYKFTEGCSYVCKGGSDWVEIEYIDTIAERVKHVDSNTMHIYTTADLGDAEGKAYNLGMDYGTLAVKINGQESNVALRYGGLRDIMFTMDAPVAGETTFEIEAGTIVKNPQWVHQFYRFTETAKFIYNADGEWVDPAEPVAKTYVETGVIVDWHGTTEEYPNTNVVLVMDQNYYADGSAITGTLGTLKVKVDGEERTVDVFGWYGAPNKLAFAYEAVPGTMIEIEPNTVVEVAEGVERTYKFTEGCSYIYNGETQKWEQITYIEGIANRVWYDGTYLQIYIDPYFTRENGDAYEYLWSLGKLDVKINGQLETKEVIHLGVNALGIAMDAPVAGETTFEIEAGTAVKNSPWTSRMYKFTSSLFSMYNANSEWVDPNAPQVYTVKVSANDGSDFSINVNAGESYTLPAKINDKVVLGYVVGGVNRMAGESITVNESIEISAKVARFSMIDGADIRVGFEKGGIRFAANINYDELANSGYVIEKVGFMIIPTDYLLNTEFKYENFTANDKDGFVDVELSTYSDKDKITATMIDLDESLYNKKFSARAYVKYTVDGVSKYVYTDYDQDKNSRSCYEVALLALADDDMEEDYSELKAYCDNIIDLTEVGGQVSITENEYSEYSTLRVESATAQDGVLTVKITGINVNAGTGILYNGVRYTSASNVTKGEGYVQFSIEVLAPV